MKDNSERAYSNDSALYSDENNAVENNVQTWDLHKSSKQERAHNKHPQGISFGSISEHVFQSFSNFWQKLIYDPTSIDGKDETPLDQYLIQKEGAIYESEFLNSTLAQELGLENDIKAVEKAKRNCMKIFHEDYPGSYILAYNGKRLGACFLNTIKSSDNTWEISYLFNADIKRF